MKDGKLDFGCIGVRGGIVRRKDISLIGFLRNKVANVG
jgi:hypothetical protein